MARKRNYAKEGRWQSTPEQIDRRVARNRARRRAMKKGLVRKGDNKEVHHVGSHRRGSLDRVRTKVISRAANRRMQPKRS